MTLLSINLLHQLSQIKSPDFITKNRAFLKKTQLKITLKLNVL